MVLQQYNCGGKSYWTAYFQINEVAGRACMTAYWLINCIISFYKFPFLFGYVLIRNFSSLSFSWCREMFSFDYPISFASELSLSMFVWKRWCRIAVAGPFNLDLLISYYLSMYLANCVSYGCIQAPHRTHQRVEGTPAICPPSVT